MASHGLVTTTLLIPHPGLRGPLWFRIGAETSADKWHPLHNPRGVHDTATSTTLTVDNYKPGPLFHCDSVCARLSLRREEDQILEIIEGDPHDLAHAVHVPIPSAHHLVLAFYKTNIKEKAVVIG